MAGLDSAQRERMGLTESPSPLRLADLVLVDSTAWFAAPEAAVAVSDLASTLRHRRRLRIRYRRSAESQASTRVVDPYGLVTKSGRWYLVADDQGDSRLLALERLSAFEQLDAPAVLQPGETLRTRWAVLKKSTEDPGRVSVTVSLPETGLDLARRILGTRIHHVTDAENGSCVVVVRYPDIESVRQLLQFGDHIEVLAPGRARARVGQLARALADRHYSQGKRAGHSCGMRNQQIT